MLEADQGVRNRIHAFVMSNFPAAAARGLSDDDSLLNSGVVDSLGILQLATFLEQEFRFIVQDDELSGDNFDTIAALTRYVSGKQAGSKGTRASSG